MVTVIENKLINKEIRRISNSSSLPVLIYTVLSTVIASGISLLTGLLCKSFPENKIFTDYGFYSLLVYVAVYLILIPLLLLLFYKTRGKKTGLTLKSSFAKPRKPASWCAKWILIALGITYLSAVLSQLIFTAVEALTDTELSSPDMTFGNTPLGIITTVLAAPIFAPIFEELLFRATVFRNNETMGQWFAIIVSGVTFGLWHTNYAQFIYTAVMGMFACFIYAKTRSVIPSIILHFLLNAVGTVQSLCFMSISELDLADTDIEYNLHYILTNHPNETFALLIIVFLLLLIIGLIITGLVLFVIEIVRHNGKAGLSRGIFNMKNSKKIAVYFSAPVTVITFLLLITLIVIYAMPSGFLFK